MSTDDARGVERPAALTALRRFAEAQAVTARSLGQEQTERGWLDALALLDQADKQAARLIEQREAAARAEALRAMAVTFRDEASEAWGMDATWLTTGEKVARLAAEWCDEEASAVLAGQGGESGEGA